MTDDFTGWLKSSHCEGGACLEAGNAAGRVGVRDSADPHSPVLAFGADTWVRFTEGLKAV